jgi:hypothetical protein
MRGGRALCRGLLLAVLTVLMMTTPRRVPAGTVAEQRARLPAPARCEDPVEGIWKSHDFRPHRGIWEVFTLEIHHKAGTDQLVGTIHNDFWYGGPDDSEPGVCEGVLHAQVSMDAQGRVDGPRIHFHGVGQWRLDAVPCGEKDGGYVLDDFSGEIDPERLEFQSLANDGIVAINEPTVFRRIDCLPEPKEDAPQVRVVAPSFYPPKERAGGCGGT